MGGNNMGGSLVSAKSLVKVHRKGCSSMEGHVVVVQGLEDTAMVVVVMLKIWDMVSLHSSNLGSLLVVTGTSLLGLQYARDTSCCRVTRIVAVHMAVYNAMWCSLCCVMCCMWKISAKPA